MTKMSLSLPQRIKNLNRNPMPSISWRRKIVYNLRVFLKTLFLMR